MKKIIFASDSLSNLPVLAAAAFNKAGGEGIACAAITRESGKRDRLRKMFGAEEMEFPDIIDLSGLEVLKYDLIVFLAKGKQVGHPYPSLPGVPPVLTWRIDSDEDNTAGYRKALLALRPKISGLLEHGYIEALIEVRRNSEMVLDDLQEGIIAHDLERKIFFFNKAAENITGYRREQLLGRDCHQVFPGNFCGSKCSFCESGCEPDLPDKPYSLMFMTREGERRHLEVNVTAITDDYGHTQGVVASFRDLSREMALAERLGEIEKFSGIIGRDPKMQEVYRTIRELADSKVPVLISGESGTGKELVAAAIHNEGNRGSKLLVPVNCGALPENLLESELFGHVRGAFTGAVRDKKGRFELADGGTIFLDEIGDISQAMQVKLLRVLQNGTFHRVGGEDSVKVDVRVISATNKDLQEEIAAGRFREDLYYRLCVMPVSLPSLHERRNDIPLLVRHFVRQVAEEEGRKELVISPEAMDVMLTYDWPGNIRELQNVIRYLMVRCREEVARPYHLPDNLLESIVDRKIHRIETVRKRRKLTVDSVRLALEQTGNNRREAAKLLGVGRATLYRFFSANPDKF